MVDILPGILEKEWEPIEKKIALVKPFVKAIHVDLLDGKFAPNTTLLDPTPFAKYISELFFELHMMVDDPLQYLKPFANAGFKRFIGHVERMRDIEEFIVQGQILGEVGLAIDAQTPVSAITIPFDDLDFMLVMTVKAGYSRQAFLPEGLEKVKTIRQAQGPQFAIEIDGGVNAETIKLAHEAGATRFVATSFLFGAENPEAQYQVLQGCLAHSA